MKKIKKQIRKSYFDGHANVWLPVDIHRAAKSQAALEGITLKDLFTKAVASYLQINISK